MVHVVLKVDTSWIYFKDIVFFLQGEYRGCHPKILPLQWPNALRALKRTVNCSSSSEEKPGNVCSSGYLSFVLRIIKFSAIFVCFLSFLLPPVLSIWHNKVQIMQLFLTSEFLHVYYRTTCISTSLYPGQKQESSVISGTKPPSLLTYISPFIYLYGYTHSVIPSTHIN